MADLQKIFESIDKNSKDDLIRNKRKVTTTITINDQLKNKLEKVARFEDLKKSTLARMAIGNYLKEYKEGKR